MHASVIRKIGEQNYSSMTYGVSLLYSWLFSLKFLLEYIISMPVKYAFFYIYLKNLRSNLPFFSRNGFLTGKLK